MCVLAAIFAVRPQVWKLYLPFLCVLICVCVNLGMCMRQFVCVCARFMCVLARAFIFVCHVNISAWLCVWLCEFQYLALSMSVWGSVCRCVQLVYMRLLLKCNYSYVALEQPLTFITDCLISHQVTPTTSKQKTTGSNAASIVTQCRICVLVLVLFCLV